MHREVIERGKPRIETSLQVPQQFSIECTASRETGILDDSKIAYLDKSCRLTLRDDTYGLNKSVVKLSGFSDGGVVESAIVWERVPYLSSVPAKVSLGTHPLRVFLRCPDETVELTKVLSSPRGIRRL